MEKGRKLSAASTRDCNKAEHHFFQSSINFIIYKKINGATVKGLRPGHDGVGDPGSRTQATSYAKHWPTTRTA